MGRAWEQCVAVQCIYPRLLLQCGLFIGEANANFNRDLYNCTFPALIEDWRQTFHRGSQGQTERFFPFGFVQVCAERRRVWGTGVGMCCAMPFPGICIPFLAFTVCCSRTGCKSLSQFSDRTIKSLQQVKYNFLLTKKAIYVH